MLKNLPAAMVGTQAGSAFALARSKKCSVCRPAFFYVYAGSNEK